MSSLPEWMQGLVAGVREQLTRAALARTVLRQTGLGGTFRVGGLKALLRSGGKTTPSQVFRYHAGNTPHRTALIYRDRSYSYFEMNEQMDRVAAALRAKGIGPGQAVVLMLKNVPEFLLLQTGSGRHGVAAVSASWRCTAPELVYLVKNSGAKALFFDASVADVVRQALPELAPMIGDCAFSVRGESEGFATYEGLLGEGDAAADAPLLDRSDAAAVVIYTSGTTGKPKGAVRKFSKDSAVQILSFVKETPLAVNQTHLTVCPLYHSTAYGFVALTHLMGGTVVLLDRFTPEGFLDALERHRVDHTAVVPTLLHRTLALGEDTIRAHDTSCLRAIFTGGAPLSGPLANEVMDTFGEVLFNFYGATETGFVSLAKPADLRAAPGTIGKAVGGNELRLLGDDGEPCPNGHVGELFVRSGNLVAGYHANADATQKSMRDGFFSVGDLARCDQRGYLFIEGRKGDMIISGGVNVYPREVEAVLAGHPAIGEAAVIGVPDDEWGERVRAFVALRSGETCDEPDLMAYCRKKLSGPKRPREIHFMDRLPRNPTGKVLKRQLRDL